MSTLVLYESKTGFTEQCAKTIHDHILGSELSDIHAETMDFNDFDTVLIGAPSDSLFDTNPSC